MEDDLADEVLTRDSFGEAEPLYKRALAIDEKAHGPQHPEFATGLSNLAELYRVQGRYGGYDMQALASSAAAH